MSYAINLNDIWQLKDKFIIQHLVKPFLSKNQIQISDIKYDDVGILFKSDVEEKQIKSMKDLLENGTSGKFKGFGKNKIRFYKREKQQWLKY